MVNTMVLPSGEAVMNDTAALSKHHQHQCSIRPLLGKEIGRTFKSSLPVMPIDIVDHMRGPSLGRNGKISLDLSPVIVAPQTNNLHKNEDHATTNANALLQYSRGQILRSRHSNGAVVLGGGSLHQVLRASLFVAGVCLLISSTVALAYIIGIPYWWHRSAWALVILLIVGHWVLINMVFHYIMAAVTSPGYLPTGVLIPEAVSICKKCIAPKPPRTHHCSVCHKCILKMDHHCPWLNNCIGHFNHRYFFLFMAYTVLGVLFLMIFGYGMLAEHVWPKHVVQSSNSTIMNFLANSPVPDTSFVLWIKKTKFYHNSLMYLAFLCLGVIVTLGGLVVWHIYLISTGQTSIEALINKAEKIRCNREKKKFVNPYDFGISQNWKIFLGLYEGRNWRHVLFPSWHKPIGTGLQWPTVTQCKQCKQTV